MTIRKITRLSWQNYKGLADGKINAEGYDVTISGRNGAGKSTIAGLPAFVLFGKTTGTAKKYDERGTAIAAITPAAEIEFDDGTTLRREVGKNNASRLYINGGTVTATKFNAFVETYTAGAGMLLINLFEFASLPWQEQRNFLLQNFVKADKPKEFDGLSVDVFKTRCVNELKPLKREVAGIPYQIEELQRQLDDMPKATLDELKAQIAMKTKELTELQSQSNSAEIFAARQNVSSITSSRNLLERDLREKQARKERLLKQYRELGKACPLCGSVLTAAKLQEARAPIVVEGKVLASEIETLTAKGEELSKQIDAAQKALTELESKRPTDINQRKATLQKEITNLQSDWAILRNAERISSRIKDLVSRERDLNARIAELEGKIAEADDYKWRQMQASEEAVNAQFETVTFKLFRQQANGEIKETCEAMIEGVPYTSLSKGEKLKASMDILRALQKHFGLEMPLIVDDAESYTSNSFVDLPNQMLLCKVAERDLTITVAEGRKEVAA